MAALKPLLEPPLRRYAGIVLDVMLDHALIRHWHLVCDSPHAGFAAEVYASLARMEPHMPADARKLSQRMREFDLLGSCSTLDGCERTLRHISGRLARPVRLGDAIGMISPVLERIDEAAVAAVASLREATRDLAQRQDLNFSKT